MSYAGTCVPMFVPKLGLIKPGRTYVCPQLWAFCMKPLLLTCFCIFGRPVISSVLKASLDTYGLFQLANRDTSHNALTFYLPSEDRISDGNISSTESSLSNIPHNGDSDKILELVFVKYVLSKGGLILETVATFVQKASLIWRQSGFYCDYSVHKRDSWLKLSTIGTITAVLCVQRKKD